MVNPILYVAPVKEILDVHYDGLMDKNLSIFPSPKRVVNKFHPKNHRFKMGSYQFQDGPLKSRVISPQLPIDFRPFIGATHVTPFITSS